MTDDKKNIIVGSGLAGTNLAFQLVLRHEDFVVIDPCPKVTSSSIAAGVYNPIVPRRQILSWKAEELIASLIDNYTEMESWLQSKFLDHDLPIYHPINSEHHLKEWQTAIDNGSVTPFVNRIVDPMPNMTEQVIGAAEVRGGGRLQASSLLDAFRSKLTQQGQLIKEEFDFDRLELNGDSVNYGSIKAERIFFCEGHRLTKNPLFDWVPMKPAKGQILTLKTNEALENAVYSKRCFFVEDQPTCWKLGATFEWNNVHSGPDKAGKADLELRLSEFLDIEYQIMAQEAGIRPTMHDRRPVVGRHPQQQNVYLLNGLGTKGTMSAPWCAQQLCDYIFERKNLDPEVDIQRTFRKYYQP
jgi:glycine oxidase